MIHPRGNLALLALLTATLAGCLENSGRETASATAQSCMTCHNGSQHNDYAGPGLENPHPFPGADNLQCTTCHGGNPQGGDKLASHVPPPPEIGDRTQWEDDDYAYFNRLTLTGLDKLPDYQANGQNYTALDYLQFVNPGDLRVAIAGRSCGQCHQSHADCVAQSPLATETGVFSGASFSFGVDHKAGNTDYFNTAADMGFRAVVDPNYVAIANQVGPVPSLSEYPVYSERNVFGANQIHQNQQYRKAVIEGNQLANNQVVSDSPLAHLLHEQVAYTCGDCHLGSAGANNRYGDFRSSGCTACHMQYSLDGRSGSRDPNVPRDEPADPDNIREPELAHVRAHRINSVAKTLANGQTQLGIDDYACAGCHQGSNRTVMQYWGIRLDQNEDVHNGDQYPDDPDSFRTTFRDPRLFDPVVGNNTFNGRRHRQYLLEEDYDGDGKDDTPADVHYEAGMGCIDCHGSHDLHGGDPNNPGANKIMSRMEQAVAISCEDCHGTISSYARTTMGQTYAGAPAEVGLDSKNNAMRHVVKEGSHYFLYSRLTGNKHYIPQTQDTVVDNSVINQDTGLPVYNKLASYAMGRDDGNPNTGIGPQQQNCNNCTQTNFSHTDRMSCVSCHAAWTNTCMGCHLEGEYRGNGNEFSNITGDEIVFREKNADFVYQSPVMMQLGVNAHGKITQVSSNTKTFFKYFDLNGDESKVFAFSDRNGNGNNPAHAFRALGHNAIMAHSIRGRAEQFKEGPRYCAACHLTTDGLTNYGGGNYNTGVANYQQFINDMAAGNYASLPFNQLKTQIGRNTGNELNSPLFVHMVAGLGSGLFLFDADGCAVNPLDENANRVGCNEAPSTVFNQRVGNVVFNLDRVVEMNGQSNASSNHPMLDSVNANPLRNGALNQFLAGPLGMDTVRMLAHPTLGVVLDSWIHTDREIQGQAGNFIP